MHATHLLSQIFIYTELAVASKSKANKLPLIVGVAAGGAVLVAVLVALIVVLARRKRKPKKNDERSQSFG